jgi:hypothetical protein
VALEATASAVGKCDRVEEDAEAVMALGSVGTRGSPASDRVVETVGLMGVGYPCARRARGRR